MSSQREEFEAKSLATHALLTSMDSETPVRFSQDLINALEASPEVPRPLGDHWLA